MAEERRQCQRAFHQQRLASLELIRWRWAFWLDCQSQHSGYHRCRCLSCWTWRWWEWSEYWSSWSMSLRWYCWEVVVSLGFGEKLRWFVWVEEEGRCWYLVISCPKLVWPRRSWCWLRTHIASSLSHDPLRLCNNWIMSRLWIALFWCQRHWLGVCHWGNFPTNLFWVLAARLL